jgi:hypothetical protein
MVGTGGVRTQLIPINEININTKFGAFANKFIHDHSGQVDIRGFGRKLTAGEILELKKSWHKLFTHCLTQIDARFSPENMKCFQLMQVLDPTVVYGSFSATRRHQIGSRDLAVVVTDLVTTFELPLHLCPALGSKEDIQNVFTVFRTSELCAKMWKDLTK